LPCEHFTAHMVWKTLIKFWITRQNCPNVSNMGIIKSQKIAAQRDGAPLGSLNITNSAARIDGEELSGDFNWAQNFNEPVGDVLRKAREYYNLSISDVEQALRIRSSYIQGLEENDIAALPGRVYAIGFIRAYSDFLQLESDKILYLFKRQCLGNESTKPNLYFPIAANESKVPTIKIIAGSVAGLLCLIIAVMVFTPKTQQSVIPPVASVIENNAAPVAGFNTQEIASALNEINVTAGNASQVISRDVSFQFKEKTWFEISKTEGDILVSRVFEAGETFDTAIGDNSYVLRTGNLGGFSMLYDGQKIAPQGQSGDVGKNITLDIAYFEERLPPLKTNTDVTENALSDILPEKDLKELPENLVNSPVTD